MDAALLRAEAGAGALRRLHMDPDTNHIPVPSVTLPTSD